MLEEGKYKSIFKSTFLFGFVQVVRILVAVIKNKIVAILLGAEGMGIMGIYSNAKSFIQIGAGLGLSQSAVRDISEAKASNDWAKFSRVICVVRKVVLFTSLLGMVITMVMSSLLSRWGFGVNNYTVPFIFLGIAVFFEIFVENQLAILKGMRQLHSLAKASIWGSVVGLITGVPLYFWLGVKGVVPSFIATAIAIYFVTRYYVNKIEYDKIKLTIKEVSKEASPMITMGSALMFTALLASVATFIVAAFMRYVGGLNDVGYYNAGMAIITSYFNVIVTALMTDYYPRIAAVNHDNEKLSEELNQQSMVSIILACPIVVVFLLLVPYFVIILYTKEFLPIVGFMKIAMFGTLTTMLSNQVDMILVAKFQTKIFTVIAVFVRVVQVAVSLLLYKYFGLIGMGITLLFMALLHMTIMTITVYKLYKIRYRSSFIKVALLVYAIALAAVGTSEIENLCFRYSIGTVLIGISVLFLMNSSKKYMNINFLTLLKNKLHGKK